MMFRILKMIKSTCSIIRTHLCTIAISLTLYNSLRLPREAFYYGPIPYLLVYTICQIVLGLATALLQLATGQLSQQDAVGVWRAVPILKGVGYIQLLTSFVSCVYNMVYVVLALAYIIWISKDSFPLKACSNVHITPVAEEFFIPELWLLLLGFVVHGYENKMNASTCFNQTFLTTLSHRPEYLGVMAVLIFILWIFIPIMLNGLMKSFRITVSILTPATIILAIILSSFLSESAPLSTFIVSCKEWRVFFEPYIWFSCVVQSLLANQIAGGYLISAGSTVYKHSDVRWVTISITVYNIMAGWLWVLFWESIGGRDEKDVSSVTVLLLIYQSSASLNRPSVWPILAFLLVFLSGVITILFLLMPIYDRLHRVTDDKWKLVAGVSSVLGITLSLVLLINTLEAIAIVDDLLVPVLAVFTTTLEIVGFVFIYGYRMLRIDIEFLTGNKPQFIWILFWCITPVILISSTGWWLRALLRETVEDKNLWPLGGVLIAMLLIMAIAAAISVAKEEQYNLISKISAAFRSSRQWGPEDPTIRYNWMLQRNTNDQYSNGDEQSIDSYSNYRKTFLKSNVQQYNEFPNDYYKTYSIYTNNIYSNDHSHDQPFNDRLYTIYSLPKSKHKADKFYSPNVCIANNTLDGRIFCNCNRHFSLHVPNLQKSEISTSL